MFRKLTKRTALAAAGLLLAASAVFAASISSYATKSAPYAGADLLLGSDSAATNATKNFSLTNLASFFLAAPTTSGTATLGGRLVGGTANTLTAGATISLDPTLGSFYKVTLNQNSTMGAVTTGLAGQFFFFEVDENGTGGFTLTGGTGWSLPALTNTAAGSRNIYFCFMPTSAGVLCK
ncbi:hypothetical protein [Gloeobacter kilaueensis]|uniref:Uncharacterized protein n=1 Tax=Gloeobacter kilaueensis (strain ATCC BAA-2537 / CCAP 1431/1 / ULC 316 / JS1) TaxID=1183438 RepID=U5QE43_GLOK1|nr:hypothetical protein [Gloeobacter kilaueensis]AGY57143.1 hypothetical protein GKIL_0897 [Gloeobacter kilaueensis JS1]